MGVLPASGEFMSAVTPHYRDIEQVSLIHDDGIIAGRTEEEHDRALHAFLERTKQLGLTLNPKKCIFKQTEIPFWGFLISDKGIRPNPEKVKALQHITRPQSKEGVVSFLAMLRSNADFIPMLATKTKNLRSLTKKGVPFHWDKTMEDE